VFALFSRQINEDPNIAFAMFKRYIASALANQELTKSMGLRKTLNKLSPVTG
jgi:hypothetical protein